MKASVPLEQFEWWRPVADSLARREGGLDLGRLCSRTISRGVLEEFYSANSDQKIEDFLVQNGPLTVDQKAKSFITFQDFKDARLMLEASDSRTDNIALVGLPGVSFIFRPHSLLDYLRLLALEKRINTRICENPQCNNPVGKLAGQPSHAKVCSRACGNKVRNLRDRMAREMWGCTWAEAKKRGKQLVATDEDFEKI